MFSSILRVLILYIVVLISLRLMGKRQIGEMQPFEFVITLIIADLATIPMSERSIPLLAGAIPVLSLLLIHFVISLLTRKSIIIRKIISGKPVIIITPDGIEYEALKKLNMNMNDLQEVIRSAGYTNVAEINYAIIETNGSASVFPKAANSPVVQQDLKLENQEMELPVILISEGKVQKENLKALNVSENELYKFIEKLAPKSLKIKDICFLTLNSNGEMFIQPIADKYIEGSVNFKGELKI